MLRAPIPERPRTPERTVIGVKRGQGTRIRDVPSLKTKGFGDNVDISPVPSIGAWDGSDPGSGAPQDHS